MECQKVSQICWERQATHHEREVFCGNVNTDGLRWPRDVKYGLCPLLFKFTNIYDLRMCFQEYAWFFKHAGDGSSEVFILCLLYALKCSEIKNLNPNIPNSLSLYNFRLGIIQGKPNVLKTSATFHPLVDAFSTTKVSRVLNC